MSSELEAVFLVEYKILWLFLDKMVNCIIIYFFLFITEILIFQEVKY